MAINRHNYEEKLIDFLEGQLHEAERGELFLFLEANPDIKDQFDSLRNEFPIIDSDAGIVFPQKEKLTKRPVGHVYIDEFSWLCIAKLEGDASPFDLAKLHDLLTENPSLASDFVLFERAKLAPSSSIVFDHKGRLTHKRVGSSFVIQRYAVAASIAAFMIFVSVPTENQLENSSRFSYSSVNPVSGDSQPRETISVSAQTTSTFVANSLVAVPKIEKLEYRVAARLDTTVEHVEPVAITEQQFAALAPIKAQVIIDKGEHIVLGATDSDVRLMHMNPEENPSRFLSVGEYLAEKVVEKSGIDPKFTGSSSKAKFWQIAQAGIKGVSRVLGIPVKIDKVYDKEGNLLKISIDSKLLAVSRNF